MTPDDLWKVRVVLEDIFEVTIVLLVKNHVSSTPHMAANAQDREMAFGDLFKVTKVIVGQRGHEACQNASGGFI